QWDKQGGPPSVSLLIPGQLNTLSLSSVFLDTGLRWVCSKTERSQMRKDLAGAAVLLSRIATQHHVLLLANGLVHGEPSEARAVSVADEHVIEVFDDVERAVLCDSLRAVSPMLIALAARSKTTAQGLDSVASTRLRHAAGLVAAPLLRAGG